MGFFKRLGRLIKSNISAILDAAEDPEKSLTQLITEMQDNYRQAKSQVANAMVDEKKMRRNQETAALEAVKWMEKAQLAVKKGDDALAKTALARAKSQKQVADEYAKQVEVQVKAVANLRLALDGLEKKIEEAKRRRNVILAKKRTVEATQTIHKTVDSMKVDTDAFEEFDRLAAKVEEMEDRANVALEMSQDKMEDKFQALQLEDGLEGELETLKLEMGLVSDTRRQIEDQSAKNKKPKKAAARSPVPAEDDDDEPDTIADLDLGGDEEGEAEEAPPTPKKK